MKNKVSRKWKYYHRQILEHPISIIQKNLNKHCIHVQCWRKKTRTARTDWQRYQNDTTFRTHATSARAASTNAHALNTYTHTHTHTNIHTYILSHSHSSVKLPVDNWITNENSVQPNLVIWYEICLFKFSFIIKCLIVREANVWRTTNPHKTCSKYRIKMASPVTKVNVLSIYKKLLRESQKFEAYNYRWVSGSRCLFPHTGTFMFTCWLQRIRTAAHQGIVPEQQEPAGCRSRSHTIRFRQQKSGYHSETGEHSYGS